MIYDLTPFFHISSHSNEQRKNLIFYSIIFVIINLFCLFLFGRNWTCFFIVCIIDLLSLSFLCLFGLFILIRSNENKTDNFEFEICQIKANTCFSTDFKHHVNYDVMDFSTKCSPSTVFSVRSWFSSAHDVGERATDWKKAHINGCACYQI